MKRICIYISLIVVVLFLIWSIFIEPNRLIVTHYNLKQSNLKGLKIVFVSDFHVKPYQKGNLVKVVKAINKENPDLILSTGDFVSGHHKILSMSIEEIAQELSKLKSKYGIYAVLGNHDWWQGGERIEQSLERRGIIVLGNENKIVDIGARKLYLAGVEDITTRNIDLVKALKNTKSPTILLTHSPDVFPFISQKGNSPIASNVDLTLAGHTHGGQVVLPFVGPLVVPSDYGKKYAQGLIEENGKRLLVTKGIGTSILPIRFNCLPEIIVINFN